MDLIEKQVEATERSLQEHKERIAACVEKTYYELRLTESARCALLHFYAWFEFVLGRRKTALLSKHRRVSVAIITYENTNKLLELDARSLCFHQIMSRWKIFVECRKTKDWERLRSFNRIFKSTGSVSLNEDSFLHETLIEHDSLCSRLSIGDDSSGADRSSCFPQSPPPLEKESEPVMVLTRPRRQQAHRLQFPPGYDSSSMMGLKPKSRRSGDARKKRSRRFWKPSGNPHNTKEDCTSRVEQALKRQHKHNRHQQSAAAIDEAPPPTPSADCAPQRLVDKADVVKKKKARWQAVLEIHREIDRERNGAAPRTSVSARSRHRRRPHSGGGGGGARLYLRGASAVVDVA